MTARLPSTAVLAAAKSQIAQQLLHRAVARGVVAKSAGRAIPVLSGLIGGAADAAALQFAGQAATTIFQQLGNVEEMRPSTEDAAAPYVSPIHRDVRAWRVKVGCKYQSCMDSEVRLVIVMSLCAHRRGDSLRETEVL